MAYAEDSRLSAKMASLVNIPYDPRQIISPQLIYLRQECHKLLGRVQHERHLQVSLQAKIAEQCEQLAHKCTALATANKKMVELERSLEVETLKRQLAESRQTFKRGKKRERGEGDIVKSEQLRQQRAEPPRKRLILRQKSFRYSFSELDRMTSKALFVMDAPTYRITSKVPDITIVSISGGNIIDRLKRELRPSSRDNIEAFFLLRLRRDIIKPKFIKINNSMKFLEFNNISIKNHHDCSGEILILKNGHPTYISEQTPLKFR